MAAVLFLGCGVVHFEEVHGSSDGAPSDVLGPPDAPGDTAAADAGSDAAVDSALDAGFDSGFDSGVEDAGPSDVGLDAGPPAITVDDDDPATLVLNGPGYRVVFREEVAWAAAELYVGTPLGRDLAGDGHEASDGSIAHGPFRDSLLDPLQMRFGAGNWETIASAANADVSWTPEANSVRINVGYTWLDQLQVSVVHTFTGQRWDVDVTVQDMGTMFVADAYETGYVTVNRDVAWTMFEFANGFEWNSAAEGASIRVTRSDASQTNSDDAGGNNRFFAFAGDVNIGTLEESYRIDIGVL